MNFKQEPGWWQANNKSSAHEVDPDYRAHALRQTAAFAHLHNGQNPVEALLESAPDAMVIVDEEGQIVLINAETERMFGYPRAELLGQHVELLVPERFESSTVRTAGATPRIHTRDRWVPDLVFAHDARTAPSCRSKSALAPSKPTRGS